MSSRWRSSRWFIIAVVSVSNLTTYFLYGMVVPIFPSALVTRAKIRPEDQVFWTSVMLISETVTSVLVCPIFGYIVDVSSQRKIPYHVGLLLLATAMAMFTVARSTTVYISERVLQGCSATMVDVAGLALLYDGMGNQRLGEALGYVGMGSMVGLMAGPPLGGLVNRLGGYYAVCILGFTMVAVDAIMRLAVSEKRMEQRESLPDTRRDNQSGNQRSRLNSWVKNIALVKLLKQPRVMITLWALTVDGMVMGAFDATMPTFVERLFGWDTLAAGLVFLPMTVPALVEPVFGRLCDRFGVRVMTVCGYSMLTPSLICLQFVRHNTLFDKIILVVLVALCGLASTLAEPALFVESQMVLEEMEQQSPGVFGEKGAVAQVFSLQTMARNAGLSVGPIIGESLFNRYGWNVMAWVLGALAGATVLPMFWLSNERVNIEAVDPEDSLNQSRDISQ